MKATDPAQGEDPRSPTCDRRRFLTMCASAVVLGACGGGGGTPAAFGDVGAGNVADLPVGTLRVVAGQPVVIARDDGGLYAMTTTCTHEGCEVDAAGSGASARLDCPCHGSRFDRNGAVVNGPASSPLVHFSVTVDASGAVTVHGGTRVGPDARTAV